MTPDVEEAYRTLELPPGASAEEVRTAYLLLVNVWHPDRFVHSPQLRSRAEERLKAINRAYGSLRCLPPVPEGATTGPSPDAAPAARSRTAQECLEHGLRLTRDTIRLRRTPDRPVPNVPNLAAHLEGMQSLREAVRLSPRLATAWHALGQAHLQLGEHEQALASLNEATAIDPANALFWTDVGVTSAQLQRHEQTARAFEEVVRLQPTNASAWHALGEARIRLDEHMEGMRALRQALRLDPGLGESWLLLGRTLTSQPPVFRRYAAEALREATRILPHRVDALLDLGKALVELRRHGEAAQALRQAVDLDPTSAQAWHGLAVAVAGDRSATGRHALREALTRLGEIDPQRAGEVRELLGLRRRVLLRLQAFAGRPRV